MTEEKSQFFNFAYAIREYVNHPDYNNGTWYVKIYFANHYYIKKVKGSLNAKAWVNYLRRHYPCNNIEHGRFDSLPGFPKHI